MKKLIAAVNRVNGAKIVITLALALLGNVALADLSEDVLRVRSAWEKIKYRMPEKEQEAAFEQLAKDSAKVKEKSPKDATAAIWHGIIEASHAGAKGGIGALGLAKNAKKSLEDALAIDPAIVQVASCAVSESVGMSSISRPTSKAPRPNQMLSLIHI